MPKGKTGRTRPSALKTRQNNELFVLRFLSNGKNATEAYLETHPRASRKTAAAEGHKYLKRPEIIAMIDAELQARNARLRMEADEALEGISNMGRADIRRLHDVNGNLLPINLWPDDIADCVKAIAPTPFGWRVVLYDKLKARELMAIAGGKLRQQVDHRHTFDHAKFLADVPPPGEDDAPTDEAPS